MDPGGRIRKLTDFNRRLINTAESMSILREWNLELERELVKVPARVLDAPELVMGRGMTVKPERGDFTKGIISKPVYKNEELRRWFLMYPKKNERDASSFLQSLKEVARGMSFELAEPKK